MALQQSAETLAGGLPAFTSVRQLLKEAEGHAERSAGGGSSRLALREAISLDRISFAYTAGGPAVLRQVSMSIPAGRTTAIVGASGAGKSTLADILIGLLQPTGGRLEVDGQPLSGGDLPAWRRSVGYVPQESFLLHDTIRKNLLWAKPDATDADMWDALARAAAGGFVRARPDGLDAVVGDRGLRLSGGERQRLALARALLTQPVLLVLDEATSALDSINEQQILASVRNLRESATTLIITHRLSAVRHADLIYVLENGQIEASGTWDELVKKPGVFGAMLSAQGSYSPVSELPGFPLAVAGPPAISTRATAIHGQWPSDSS
jgi:ATP-binding cassette subfamily C protein